jgi:putative AdoMet-dependent methyltransferase
MHSPPEWQYNELRRLAVDFHDLRQVEVYDAQQGTDLGQERKLVRSLGISGQDQVIEYGAGTGAFLLAAAPVCDHIHAIDISAAMIAYARRQVKEAGLTNVSFHHGGFLSYKHRKAPVRFVVTKFALHHLPDFWKVGALSKINGYLQTGGLFFLEDVVFSFEPESYEREVKSWIGRVTALGTSFSKAQFEGHVREEFSTYSWIMEAIIQRTGFAIRKVDIRSATISSYLCEKVRSLEPSI